MRKRDKKLEMALTVYQILVDIRQQGLDNDSRVAGRWVALLGRVLSVLEEEW